MTSPSALRAFREALSGGETGRKISQASVAKQLGIQQNSVSLWVRGLSRPEHHLRLALQNLFGIPAESWFTADERRVAGLPALDPAPDAKPAEAA